jgi:hypothetical protein
MTDYEQIEVKKRLALVMLSVTYVLQSSVKFTRAREQHAAAQASEC